MTSNDEIIFDDKSGISIEEQQEILYEINGIAEKHRRSLSQNFAPAQDGKLPVINAKKSGKVFPLAVNIAAAAVLVIGALFLILINRQTDTQARQGAAVYNLMERALIEEIRKDTAERIAAKEIEISSISSRLQEVDAQLLQLYSSHEELTSEQLAAQESLLSLQDTYRQELSVLQDERSQILEDSRAREARLRAQLEERTLEIAGELDAARSELERLSTEQERIAAIDAQLAGGLESVSELVQNGQYAQAARTIESLRNLNNNSLVSNARAFQARRQIYNQAIGSMELIIDEMQKFMSINSEGWELFEKNTELEETIADMQKTIEAFSAGSSGLAARLSEMEESLSVLRTANSTLETSVAERDRTISSLESERASLTQTVADMQTINTAYEQEIASLRNQIDIIRQALQD